MNDKFIATIQALTHPIKEFICQDTLTEIPDILQLDDDERLREYNKTVNYYAKVADYSKKLYYVVSMLSERKMHTSPNTPNGSMQLKQINNYLAYLKNLTDALSYVEASVYRRLNFFEKLK